ncbi:MAG TPA: hypothetical protein VFB06_10800 [Streptosporangiaceae bacterium]|nr:hypothetical protein [Streptosporangiaceae bacterium]
MAINAHRVVQRVAGKGLAWGCAIALGAALVSCGAPSFSYIADSGNHTYFKVPYGWKQITSTQLCNALDKSNASNCESGWLVAYEPGTKPAATDFLSPRLSKPFVFAEVTGYNAATNGPLTDDTLRNFFLPVTASARSAFESQQGTKLTGFKQLRDDTLALSGGFHGVRETFNFGLTGTITDTYDEMAIADSAGDTVYFIVAHCTAACYSQDHTAIDDVISSFTVRSR